MTTPPRDESDSTGDQPPAPEPFDPYRFGAPEHPVPPEYAPPGYQPPAVPPPGYQQPYPGQPGPYAGGSAPYAGQPAPYAGGPYPYPPPYSQYPLPKTGNGKATAGLILGIISIVFFWLSFFDAIPVVLGLIFGFLGLNESKRTGSGRGPAIAGIVCAFIGAALAIVLTIVIVTRLRPCFDNYNSGSSEFNSCVRHRI